MAKVNLVQKKVLVGHGEIIKYQLLTYCFIDGVQLSMSELNCLTLLAYNGEIGLSEFCTEAVDKKIFKTSQTVRNFLNKASKKGLILKTGTNKKTVQLKPEMNVQTKGNIMLDYKIIYATQEE